MVNEVALINENEFMRRLSVALNIMGFNTSVVESDDYPISIETKLVGYEDLPVDILLIFLPVQEVLGKQSQVLQIYFSLYDSEVSRSKFRELKQLFNQYNMSTMVGTFGVQDDIKRICYKQGVMLPLGIGIDKALNLAMQTFTMMSLTMDGRYENILNIVTDANEDE